MIIEIIENHTPPDFIPLSKSYPLIIVINSVLLSLTRTKSSSPDFMVNQGVVREGVHFAKSTT